MQFPLIADTHYNKDVYINTIFKNLSIPKIKLFLFSKVEDPNTLIIKKKDMFDQIYEKVRIKFDIYVDSLIL